MLRISTKVTYIITIRKVGIVNANPTFIPMHTFIPTTLAYSHTILTHHTHHPHTTHTPTHPHTTHTGGHQCDKWGREAAHSWSRISGQERTSQSMDTPGSPSQRSESFKQSQFVGWPVVWTMNTWIRWRGSPQLISTLANSFQGNQVAVIREDSVDHTPGRIEASLSSRGGGGKWQWGWC